MASSSEIILGAFERPGSVQNSILFDGRIEPDVFVINDIILRIPPTSIRVEKTSFNQELQTLRSTTSLKTKSGYSLARVSFTAEFRLSNLEDNENLRRLVAGLRATPFCIVFSPYLDKALGRPDHTGVIASTEDVSYSNFKPIMLGLSTMVFETLGHEGTPDLVRGIFDFLNFNYLPYTDTIALRTGNNYDRPGFAWNSPLWKKFYEPFYVQMKPANFPHQEEDIKSRTTEFLWREFLAVPKGDLLATQATKELVEALKNKPKYILSVINDTILGSTIASEPAYVNEALYDIVYRKLISNGSIKPNDDMQRYMETNPSNITAVANSILSPLVKKINFNSKNTGEITQPDLNEIEQAAIRVTEKLSRLTDAQKKINTLNSSLVNDSFTKLLDTDGFKNINGKNVAFGGLELYGKKQRLKIEHYSAISQPMMILTRISISFQNQLAVVPMLGYQYPTLQYVGGSTVKANLSIDATNQGLDALTKMYDAIETGALRYKQIPQGLNNLWINNDFLRMFNVSEFQLEGTTAETIEGSPGRSLVSLALSEASPTSSTRMSNPEALEQEFVQTSEVMQKEIFKRLWKYMMEVGGFKKEGRSIIGEVLGLSNAVNTPDQFHYYEVKPQGLEADLRNSIYKSLVDEVAELYNGLLKNIHFHLFKHGTYQGTSGLGGFSSTPSTIAYSPLDFGTFNTEIAEVAFSLLEEDPSFGYIPRFNQIKKSIKNRYAAIYGNSKNTSLDSIAIDSKKLIERQKAEKKAQYLLGEKAVKNKSSDKLRFIKDTVIKLGIPDYQTKIHALLLKIQDKYLGLPQFSDLRIIKEKEGLGKGMMAYPDFKEQITSIARGIDTSIEVSDNELLNYNPDVYFWYSTIHGSSTGSDIALIDPYFITEAKRHSKNIYNKAQGSVNDFFQNVYLERLKNAQNMGPYDVLTKENKATSITQPLYQTQVIKNYLKNTDKPTHLEVVPDPGKIYTNQYPEKNPSLITDSLLCHATDIDSLWNGVSYDSKEKLPDMGKTKTITPNDNKPNELNYNYQKGKDALDFVWPVRDIPTKPIRPSCLFGAPRDYRKGTHAGIDLPHHSLCKSPYGPNDGIYGSDVLAVADGTLLFIRQKDVGGLYIGIKHANNFISMYMHLLSGSISSKLLQDGKPNLGVSINRGEKIACIGRTGNKTSFTHLHFQISKNGQYIDPLSIFPSNDVEKIKRQQSIENPKGKTTAISRGVVATSASPLMLSIEETEKEILSGQGQGLIRAYPAFKLYFIEDDSGERKRLAFDDFFSYAAVQSIRVVRSRKIAADLCEIYVTNISGILSNRKFSQSNSYNKGQNQINDVMKPRTATGEVATETTQKIRAGTKKENPIASLLLQEGINIHLKLGFSNDPDQLETVFNGVITEVEFSDADDVIRIVAQSYAIELVQDIKGVDNPKKKYAFGLFGWDFWGFTNNAATGRVLEEMMAQPEVVHFGRWNPRADNKNQVRDLLTQRWTFKPQIQDDNIFAPDPTSEFNFIGNKANMALGLYRAATNLIGVAKGQSDVNFIVDTLAYTIYRTTIWDIFQEMTLRNPNYVASAIPYKAKDSERMTMFFGLPNQLYFARDPSAEEEFAYERFKSLQIETIDKLTKDSANKRHALLQQKEFQIGRGISGLIQIEEEMLNKAKDEVKKKTLQNRFSFAKNSGFIKPFRNYHLITSSKHIISNNIRALSRDVANTVVVEYGVPGASQFFGGQQQIIKVDNALPTEETRTQRGYFYNVTNPELAVRYGLGLLMRNLKDIYKGDICIIGNPKIKPLDVCLTENNLILTNDGYKPIQDIQLGDTVYSHKSKQQKVTQLFKHKPYEKILEVKCNADPEKLIATENHPVLSVLRTDIYKNGKVWNKQDNFIPRWRCLGSLKENDYLAQPRIHSNKTLPIPLARLLGYYLAEGSIIWEWRKSFNKGRKHNRKGLVKEQSPIDIKCCRVPIGIQYSFNSETEFFMVEEINRLLKELGYQDKTASYSISKQLYKNRPKKGLTIQFYDRNLASQFIKLAGYNDKEGPRKDNKWLRDYYDTNTTKHILASYFEGDGCFSKEIKITSATTSLNLGRNIRQLLINLGIPVCSNLSKVTGYKRTSKPSKAYYNIIPTTSTYEFKGFFTSQSRFANINTIEKSLYSASTTSIVDDLFVYLSISEIKESDNQNVYVYNIGVENDNSYIAQNKAVHNCYLFDEYNDMIGAIEVEEVQHIFDYNHGFRTEIKPDMLVQASEWSILSSNEAMGIVMEGLLKNLHSSNISNDTTYGKILSWYGSHLGNTINYFGGFLARKILDYTQFANPIVMSPLLHHGRPFTGGVPTRKIPTTLWNTILGDWTPETEEGFDMWVEDRIDEIKDMANIFNNMQGNFFNNGGDSPE